MKFILENDYMEDQDQDPDEEGSVIILYVEGLFYIFEVLGDKTNLFVKNLPRNMSEQKLHQIFSVFGEVSSAKIMVHFYFFYYYVCFVDGSSQWGIFGFWICSFCKGG
jgi:hypothetical protein